jgi:predicted helicase
VRPGRGLKGSNQIQQTPPKPVVSFIVRSVDEILRIDFALEYGLADTTTWGEMAKRNKRIKIPDGVSENDPFVQILDPATGTGTFLVEAIALIYKTMIKKWEREGHLPLEFNKLWNEYIPKHLLPRIYGFELMMAPYAIAHMKVGLKLYETGYRFNSNERARIYLTNSLEPAQDFSNRF